MGGVNIHLYKHISLSLNYNMDFFSDENFPLFPRKGLSRSLETGIIIEL